jgi:hypothetical protein
MGREGTTVQLEGLILFAGTCPPGLELIMASDGSNVAGHTLRGHCYVQREAAAAWGSFWISLADPWPPAAKSYPAHCPLLASWGLTCM